MNELDEVSRALLRLARDVVNGIVSSDEALSTIRDARYAQALNKDIAFGASEAAWEIAMKTDWRAGTALHALLNACLDARDARNDDPRIPVPLAGNWVGIAAMAIRHAPDPTLYRDAVARGTRAVELAAEHGMPETRGDLLHGLGTLHLDPFMAKRNYVQLQQDYAAWRARAADGKTWDGTSYFDIEKEGFPSAEQALDEAERYYRQAADARSGRKRGLSLKALAQTLYGRSVLGLGMSPEELMRVATEGLQLLDPQTDAAMIGELTQYAKASGAAPTVEDPFLQESIDAVLARTGAGKTADAVLHTAQLLMSGEPQRSLRLLLDAAPLFENPEVRSSRRNYRQLLIAAFTRAHARPIQGLPDDAPIDQAAAEAAEQAKRENWDRVSLAAVLLRLASISGSQNREAMGLELLSVARELAPVSIEHVRVGVDVLEALLLGNEGSNLFHQQQWDEAAHYYMRAMIAEARLGEREGASEYAGRLHDVARRGGPDAATTVVNGLHAHLEMLETVGGEETSEWLQRTLRVAGRTLALNRGSPDLVWDLVQLAKGRRFAAMLAAGVGFRVSPEQLPTELLQRIAETRVQAAVEAPESFEPGSLDEGALLSPYSRASVRLKGKDAGELLTNLEHQFDIGLHEQLVQLSSGHSGLLVTQLAVQQAVGDRTVVLEYFLADVRGSDSVLFMSMTTSERTQWLMMRLPEWQSAELTIDGKQIVISGIEAVVSNVRNHVQDDPATGELLAAEAAASLRGLGSYLAPKELLELLGRLHAAGKDHLCIVPHGPMHYAPLHLLGDGERMLADDWVVTYVPNLALLAHGHGGQNVTRYRRKSLAAFGLGFDEAGEEFQIPEARAEAIAVAQAMGVEPVLDEEATEDALRAALRDSQYLHIATHGSHRRYAPCFQGVQLAPADSDDGSFFAYEVLGSDLRGLDLVTLSACETALGRFDLADNPHGLPAMLFLAGARTLIGTLWNAETHAAQRFFTTLYTELAGGASKLVAYRRAQQVTRAEFPQPRDWAPFYFAGDWR